MGVGIIDIIDQAAEIANQSDREEHLEFINKILEAHPGGEFIFVMVDENENNVLLSDYCSGDFQMRAWIANSYLHLLMQGFWAHPEEDEEE